MNAPFLRSKHEVGLTFEEYVQTGRDDQQRNWRRVYEDARLTEDQRGLVREFVRPINVIGLSGVWCGDCSQQCPLVQRIAEANPEIISIRWLDRDEHSDLQDRVLINSGRRVPVIIFCAEDFELVNWYGDRTLSRYRALAASQLGTACPVPGAPLAADELAATLRDWVDEFERVQLLLRLSPRLQQKQVDSI
jgi:hypothetical protein